MNDLITKARTMKSTEIAKITGKRHADVMRDIRVMLKELDISERSFASSYFDGNNQERPAIELNHDLTITLVSGYSIKMRFSIIERWKELEEADNKKPSWMVNLSPQAVLAIEDLNNQLEVAKPKLEYHDKVLAAPNGLTTSEIASELGMTAQKLNKLLKDMKIQKKIGQRWVLTAANLGQGFETEETFLDDGGVSRHSMKWTELGRKFIHELTSTIGDKGE